MIAQPHFAFPFQRDPATGGIAVVEQDSAEEILACEQVITWCPLGARQEAPGFGWEWPLFDTIPIDPTPLAQALAAYEPRGPIVSATELAGSVVSARNITIQIGAPAT